MKKNLLNISGKINEVFIDIYDLINTVSKSLAIPYCVIGATARDLILMHGYGQKIKRGTYDIDLAVHVNGWDDYNHLTKGLIATGRFIIDQQPHRLLYEGQQHLPVDIVPFGPIEDDNKISWPPEHDVVMNALGLEDACNDVQMVRLRDVPILDIPVVSPAGLAILKIIAWAERYPESNKDAKDLAYLLCTYMDAGNAGRVYDEESDLLVEGFDYVRAGAQLLGRDVRRIAKIETKKKILDILGYEISETSANTLAREMIDISEIDRENHEKTLALLEIFKKGIEENVG